MPKKIKVKNTVPDLLEAVTTHKDCPDWLKTMIYNRLADKSELPADCAEMYCVLLKYTPTRKDELRELRETELSETEPTTAPEAATDNLALLLSGVLNNPKPPPEIYNGLKRGLIDVFNNLPVEVNQELSEYEDSPEYLTKLIKYAEASNE